MSYEEEIAWGVQQMLDADLQFPQDVPDTNVVKTNADHIRAMTDDELAEFLCDATYKENEQGYPIMRTVHKVWWHKWLKQPYKE